MSLPFSVRLDFLKPYIDGIVVASKSKDQHLEHIKVVFDMLTSQLEVKKF